MLTQWDPFTEISRLQQNLLGRQAQATEAFRPAVDIYEDEQGIHVKAEVAGVKPEDLTVDVDNRVLTISGERKLETTTDDKGYHRVERRYGSFSRSFSLANDVNPDDIKADYKDGVLTVLLPKVSKQTKKQIAVNALR